ncbi:ketopantoate hydroxymethyltransferase [Fomitopsis serialis]|uniref:ketopantoate hydroxymethyltransferase n=1 Tax=Fomitopsis serialis TaxID=139415 RepID=UPI0020087ADE|nr:ketopantoate hydroxymethyltransferase [Neoantrodia serialis]KAH9915510.1 ketopantoate hydroxymethyltransferase [Neoantrodia serialis]
MFARQQIRSMRLQQIAGNGRRWMSKITIQHLHGMKRKRTPIAMLTAYDFPTGRACEAHGVDITLVGDSLAQVCLGYDATTRLTLDEMIHHCRAVARGSAAPLLVADMPFGTYHAGADDAVRNAVRLVREGGAEAVKIEGGREVVDTVRRLTTVGIPVMGHIGLLPQRQAILSGYRVQGRSAGDALGLVDSALALEDAGAFAIVLEAIPHAVGSHITRRLRQAATIGIGAGWETDGQVLVWDDLMGTWGGHKAKFVRRFGDVRGEVERGVKAYVQAVRDRSFPSDSESYEMPAEEAERFCKLTEIGNDQP